jgi:H+/Cl- antiporter ClcA
MKYIWRLLIIAVLIAAGALIIPALTEAYGSGAPYYGQTTNMDKWQNPLPFVAGVGIVASALSALFWRLSISKP